MLQNVWFSTLPVEGFGIPLLRGEGEGGEREGEGN
jgi:hypothetical protein